MCLVRDRDRGIPDRATPRIVAKSAGGTDSTVEVASADTSEKSKLPESSIVKAEPTEKTKSSEQKEKPQIEITDSKRVVKQTSSNGKTRVVMHGGSGKSVAIAVNKGKVRTMDQRENEDKANLAKKSTSKSVATAKSEKEDESQGG